MKTILHPILLSMLGSLVLSACSASSPQSAGDDSDQPSDAGAASKIDSGASTQDASSVLPENDAGSPVETPDGSVAEPTTLSTISGASILTFPIEANGNVAPSNVIAGAATGLADGTTTNIGLAIAPDGTTYVNTTSAILVFAPGAHGNVAPARVIAGASTLPSGSFRSIALDPSGATLFATTTLNSVRVFPASSNGDTAPTRVIAGADTSMHTAISIYASASELYVANDSPSASVTVFNLTDNGNATPKRTLDLASASLLSGMVLDGSGDLAIAWNTSQGAGGVIATYAAAASGSALPLRTVTGNATDVVGAGGVALDPNGNLYVSDNSGGNVAIVVFAPSSNGNSSPIRNISGASTTLVAGVLMPIVLH